MGEDPTRVLPRQCGAEHSREPEGCGARLAGTAHTPRRCLGFWVEVGVKRPLSLIRAGLL